MKSNALFLCFVLSMMMLFAVVDLKVTKAKNHKNAVAKANKNSAQPLGFVQVRLQSYKSRSRNTKKVNKKVLEKVEKINAKNKERKAAKKVQAAKAKKNKGKKNKKTTTKRQR